MTTDWQCTNLLRGNRAAEKHIAARALFSCETNIVYFGWLVQWITMVITVASSFIICLRGCGQLHFWVMESGLQTISDPHRGVLIWKQTYDTGRTVYWD